MKYKKICILGVSLITAMAALQSCSSETVNNVLFSSELIKVRDASVELTKDAGSQQVIVEANCDWTANIENGWDSLVAQKASDQSVVNIKTNKNDSREVRTAQLVISSKNENGGVKISLPINQAKGEVSISTDSVKINYGEDGGQRSFKVQSNTTWELNITYPSDDKKWLSADSTKSSGEREQTVTLTAEKATTDVERNAVVTIKCTESGVTKSVQLNVNQSGLSQIYLKVKPASLDFGAIDSEPQKIEISESNAKWWLTPISIDPLNDTAWIEISEREGVGERVDESKISIRCKENTTPTQRLATLIFTSGNKNGGQTQQVMIEQEAGQYPEVTGFAAVSTENIQNEASFTLAFSSQFSVTEYGVCYSATNQQPTVNDEHIDKEANEKTATDTVKATNLQPRTTYYFRAYAKSAVGVAYSSNVVSITTLGEKPEKDDNPPLFVRK